MISEASPTAFVPVAQAETIENQKALSEFYNRLLFTGSDRVVQTAIAWWTEVSSQGNKGELNSPTLKRLIDGMRYDLGISRRSILKESTFVVIGFKRDESKGRGQDESK